MEIQIEKRYLIFPVNTLAKNKKLTLSSGGNALYTLNIRLDNIAPDYHAYIDVSEYVGKVLSLSVSPEMEIVYDVADEMNLPSLYEEPYRPQVHFSTKNGWINDPNGLMYLDGVYHLFYQHNPCENRWNNMHWGHATSRDMLHWQEEGVALFPDKTGAMFSGSAIVDKENLLSLQEGETQAVLLYYTATEPFSQYMAYSTDGLRTIKKYSDVPVIPHITAQNRDPNVTYVGEWGAYALALFLDGDVYGIFRSDDLVHFSLVQKFSLEGDWECPDFFPIASDEGVRKWVLMGARGRYAIGDMREEGFVPSQDVLPLHYGKSAYAGQTFSGLPEGRIVRIDWDKWDIPNPNIRGQMSIPYELRLKETDGVYYLMASPVEEIRSLYEDNKVYEGLSLARGVAMKEQLQPSPYLIRMQMTPDENTEVTLDVFGVRMTLSAKKNAITLAGGEIPLTLVGNLWDMTAIFDRHSVELYLDGGRIYAGTVDEKATSDYNLSYLSLVANENLLISHLELHSLKSIWEK